MIWLLGAWPRNVWAILLLRSVCVRFLVLGWLGLELKSGLCMMNCVSFFMIFCTQEEGLCGQGIGGRGCWRTHWCTRTDGLVLTLSLLLLSFQCDPAATVDGSGVISDPSLIDQKFREAWLPYFCRSVRGVADLEDFSMEVEGGWLPTLDMVDLPPLTGDLLSEVVRRKKVTAGSLDGWEWRELKALPASWFDGLASILRMVEADCVWPEGLLDAYIAMIPKVDGDATPLGQRPLCVLPVVYRVWASARMMQLEPWFKSWVPHSVFSAGKA